MATTTISEEKRAGKTAPNFSGTIVPQPELPAPAVVGTFGTDHQQGRTAKHTALERPLPVEGPLSVPPRVLDGEAAALIQVWEGTVHEVFENERSMRVVLHAKIGSVPDHFADVDLEWVSEQDLDLVRPGAVFYLSLYKARRRGGSIVNSQELRFRRRPAWTRRDASSVISMARHILAKGKPATQAK